LPNKIEATNKAVVYLSEYAGYCTLAVRNSKQETLFRVQWRPKEGDFRFAFFNRRIVIAPIDPTAFNVLPMPRREDENV
jgi:hypothetical protein